VAQKEEICSLSDAMTTQTAKVKVGRRRRRLIRQLPRYSCCSALCMIRMKDQMWGKCAPTSYVCYWQWICHRN